MQKLASEKIGNSKLTTKEFFQKYEAGDKEVKALMERVANSLAHGIFAIISLLDPHKIVLGGVINNNPFLLDLIKESLKNFLIPEQ